MIKMLMRREQSDTCLTHVCKYHWSGESPVTCRLLQLMEVTVLAASSLYFIFSPGSLRSSNVYKCESGRCRTVPFLLTSLSLWFISQNLLFSIIHSFSLLNETDTDATSIYPYLVSILCRYSNVVHE